MIEGNAISITREEMLELWERRHKELMALSKEELVKMIIGSKWEVGCIFG